MTVHELLEDLGIPTAPPGHHHVREGWAGLDCPLCSPGSHRYRLGIHPQRRNAHCWACGTVNLITALTLASGKKPREVIQHTRRIAQDALYGQRKGKLGGSPRKLVLPPGIDFMRSVHRKYLIRRGFDPDEIARVWGVMGIGLESRLPWHLFLPITLDGRVVSWTTRSLGDEGRRYINAGSGEEEVSAKHLLYGEEYCNQSVVVVEGPTDVWRIGPGAVGLFGLKYTREQVLRLSKYPVRVVYLDPEPVAQRVAGRLCRELEAYPGKTYRVKADTDPGECGPEEVEKLRRRFLS